MKKILLVTAILAGLSLANTTDTAWSKSGEPTFDSLRKADSALIAERQKEVNFALSEQHAKDSVLFATKIPDSLRSKVLAQSKEFEIRKADFDSIKPADSVKFAAVKLKVDSLRKSWEAKRDTQIARIKDTAVQAKVKAHLAEIAKSQAAVKASIEARKALIEAKIAALKAKIAAASATTK